MVHNRRIARNALHRFDPLVLGPTRIDDKPLILDGAFGRHIPGLFGHVDDSVGSGDLPAFGKLRGRRQILGIALGSAGFDPLVDQFLVAVAQPSVVAKMSDLGIGMPGRHPLFLHDFADHLGPARGVFVRGERERCDLPLAMAIDAILIEHFSDVFGVCDFGLGIRRAHAADAATLAGDRRFTHGLAREHFIHCNCQVAALGRVLLIGDPLVEESILIVDPAPIPHDAAGVEHEDLRRAHRAQLIGNRIARVLEQGELDLVFLSVMPQLRHGVLLVGIDADKRHAAILEFGGHLHQPRAHRAWPAGIRFRGIRRRSPYCRRSPSVRLPCRENREPRNSRPSCRWETSRPPRRAILRPVRPEPPNMQAPFSPSSNPPFTFVMRRTAA